MVKPNIGVPTNNLSSTQIPDNNEYQPPDIEVNELSDDLSL